MCPGPNSGIGGLPRSHAGLLWACLAHVWAWLGVLWACTRLPLACPGRRLHRTDIEATMPEDTAEAPRCARAGGS